jgi:hypothetical protein
MSFRTLDPKSSLSANFSTAASVLDPLRDASANGACPAVFWRDHAHAFVLGRTM